MEIDYLKINMLTVASIFCVIVMAFIACDNAGSMISALQSIRWMGPVTILIVTATVLAWREQSIKEDRLSKRAGPLN